MRIESMLLASLLALVGCQSPALLESKLTTESVLPACTGGSTASNTASCSIQLKAVETGSKCSVEFVDPNQADVSFQSGRQYLSILLELTNASAGYRFPKKDALAVSLDPFGNFTNGRAVGPNDERYVVLNVNSRLWGVGDYSYKVFVNRTEPGPPCVLDPWYRNR